MYNELRRRGNDRRQDGGGRRNGGNSLQYPFVWYAAISGWILGFLILVVRLFIFGKNGPDIWASSRISALLLLFSTFTILVLATWARERRQQRAIVGYIVLEPVNFAARTEDPEPEAPTQPEPEARRTHSKPKKPKRKRKSRR